jgi:hypothetical protein
MSPFAVFRRDLWMHLKRTRCIIARRHMDVHEIGVLSKKGGFRGVPLKQCHFCSEILITAGDAARYGGK